MATYLIGDEMVDAPATVDVLGAMSKVRPAKVASKVDYDLLMNADWVRVQAADGTNALRKNPGLVKVYGSTYRAAPGSFYENELMSATASEEIRAVRWHFVNPKNIVVRVDGEVFTNVIDVTAVYNANSATLKRDQAQPVTAVLGAALPKSNLTDAQVDAMVRETIDRNVAFAKKSGQYKPGMEQQLANAAKAARSEMSRDDFAQEAVAGLAFIKALDGSGPGIEMSAKGTLDNMKVEAKSIPQASVSSAKQPSWFDKIMNFFLPVK